MLQLRLTVTFAEGRIVLHVDRGKTLLKARLVLYV